MDIKLKNIKHTGGAQIAAFIIVWLCLVSFAGSAIFLLYNDSVLRNKSYYDTYQFRGEFDRLTHNVVELNVKLKSVENIKASGVAEPTIQENLSRLQSIKDRLSKNVNFAYCIKNTQTGETLTNLSDSDAVALIKKQPSAVYFNQWTSDFSYAMSQNIVQLLSDTPYEVNAAVIEPVKPGDIFYDSLMSFNKTKKLLTGIVILLIASILIAIPAFIYLLIYTGRKNGGKEINHSFVDRIYTDVYTVLVFIAALISIGSVSSVSFHEPFGLFFLALVFGIDVLIGLTYVLSMVRQIKSGTLFKNTLLYVIFDLGFNGKAFKAWTLLLLLGYGLVNGFLFAVSASGMEYMIILAFNAVAVYFSARALMSLSQIMTAAEEIAAGNIDYKLEEKNISVAFAGFAKSIRSIQGGLKEAVAEAIKGERMKTDLIANVSHDLKTPLTSVINYVDLLKKEELNNEKAKEYLAVLEDKSARLKQLIEDLIEASKASSGNLAVDAEKVDLHELVMQACGEYEEKIKKAELEVHISAAEKQVLISADGKHMWRILENLISNIIKYSLPNTRVYINIAKSELYGSLIIKNISASPLDIPPEELTERFVRGDASRTMEGSGLGLSIAQSLTGIQRGKFNLDIDGDLFKVTVELPLWQEK